MIDDERGMDMKRSPRMPRTARVIKKLSSPINNFLELDAASGILLILATTVALILANSPWRELYEHFLHTPVQLGVGSWQIRMSFHHFVNDTLMAIFFFLVGMEIKREIISGELSTVKKALLPMIAALGGMVVPALIYYFFNSEGEAVVGWGVPMATDIAFALGVISFLSRKVPFGLKIFLLTLAIVDDLGAIAVIAIFYTQSLSIEFLTYAFLSLLLIYVLHSSDVTKTWLYILLGSMTWYFVYKSGVHATAAGVALGFLMPLEALYDRAKVSHKIKGLVNKLDQEISVGPSGLPKITNLGQNTINQLHQYISGAQSALEKTVQNIHSLVSYLIVPIFAFSNTGVVFDNFALGNFLKDPVAMGIILGLFIGKPVGIFIFSFAAVKLGLGSLPNKVTWMKIISMGMIAGIGFTMALFVSNLAFGQSDFGTISKLSILIASLAASCFGLITLSLSGDVD